MHYDNRPISEINAILDALQETRRTFEGSIEILENSTYLGEEEVIRRKDKDGKYAFVPKNEGGEGVLDPEDQAEALLEYRKQLLDTNRVIIQLNLVRHRKVMAEVRDSEMIQSLSAKLKRYLDSIPLTVANRFCKRMEHVESVLNDPEFSYSNLKTLFAESEKRTFQTSNHLEESKGRLGGKYDAFFRDHFQKMDYLIPQDEKGWSALTSAVHRLSGKRKI